MLEKGEYVVLYERDNDATFYTCEDMARVNDVIRELVLDSTYDLDTTLNKIAIVKAGEVLTDNDLFDRLTISIGDF
jgi:hypothetical protein